MQKKNKFGNKKVFFDNHIFASKKEKDTYILLKQAIENGSITDLSLQPKFELIPAIWENKTIQLKTKTKVISKCVQRPITYIGDFSFYKDNIRYVVDCKISPKMLPPEYVLKEKLFRWKFGYSIIRIYKPLEILNVIG